MPRYNAFKRGFFVPRKLKTVDTRPPKLFGLKNSSHFKVAMMSGDKWVTKSFVLMAAPLSCLEPLKESYADHIGYGVVASKKVGNAVCRNKAKRRLRELIRTHLPCLGNPNFIYLFIARKELLTYDFEQLSKDLKWATKRIHQK